MEDPSAPPASRPPGSQDLVAGKYRLTSLLGQGGMGAVWEGVHISLGTKVAVKFIDPEHAGSPEIRQRFVNEAMAAARLRSKHVVQVYDQGVTADGRPYIVMEFLAGEPLDRRLDRMGRLSPPETARIVVQTCRALARAHDAGVVHRDLKPENIFLVWDEEDQTDIVKVVDFGIAKFTDGPSTTSSSTRTGTVLGTPHYMSPEQARGLRTIDHRTDLWSVGVITYRCLVGSLPFTGEALGDLLVNLCTGDPPVPSSVAPDVPPGFDAWVTRALARDPGERFGSAAELADALCEVCGLPAQTGIAPAARPSVTGTAASTGLATPRPTSAADHGTAAPLTRTGSQSVPKRAPVYAGLALAGLLGLGGLGLVVKLALGSGAEPDPMSAGGEPGAEGALPAAGPSETPANAGPEPARSPTPAGEGPEVHPVEEEAAEEKAKQDEAKQDEAPDETEPSKAAAPKQQAAPKAQPPAAPRPKRASTPTPAAPAPKPPRPKPTPPKDLLGY